MKTRSSLGIIALLVAISACRATSGAAPVTPDPGEERAISDRLFLGRSIPGGGAVSDAEWSAFVDSIVTPRFPNGLTIWRAEGQWREATGALAREPVMVLELLHPADSVSDRAVREIAAEYKRRFRQEAVLRSTEPARIRFLD
jgi:hypothetical protein